MVGFRVYFAENNCQVQVEMIVVNQHSKDGGCKKHIIDLNSLKHSTGLKGTAVG